MSGTVNRRVSERVFTRMRVLYGLREPDTEGRALNVSAAGVFISTPRPHLPGTNLHLRLLPPGAESVDVRGTVRWGQRIPPQLAEVVQPGMGVQVVSPPDAYFDLLVALAGAKTRRAHPRVEARLEVRYFHREHFLKEYTENISQGGLFIATCEPFAVGAAVEVQLLVHDLPVPLPLGGRVAFRVDQDQALALGSTPGVGVQITRMDPRTAETLRAYVRRISRLYE